jgi:hypothetical protein
MIYYIIQSSGLRCCIGQCAHLGRVTPHTPRVPKAAERLMLVRCNRRSYGEIITEFRYVPAVILNHAACDQPDRILARWQW